MRSVEDDNQQKAVKKCANSVCPLSNLSLLMYAVMTGPGAVRERLLFCADISCEWWLKERNKPGIRFPFSQISVLSLAICDPEHLTTTLKTGQQRPSVGGGGGRGRERNGITSIA